MAEIKFEEALAKLEKIVDRLESGELPLEEAIAKYEEGMNLSKICSRKLEEAREKIEILVKSDKGKTKTSPFPGGEEAKVKTKRIKRESKEESLF